jgi:hypothetical protein
VDPSALEQMVREAVDGYRQPSGDGTLGRPFTAERLALELDRLRAALVPPYVAEVAIPNDEARHLGRTGPYWVVARLSGDVVYYDEGADEYGLAHVRATGAIASVAVRGDLAGVFMAR